MWCGVVIKRTRFGREFYGCENYPKCKWATWKRPKVKGKKENKESAEVES